MLYAGAKANAGVEGSISGEGIQGSAKAGATAHAGVNGSVPLSKDGRVKLHGNAMAGVGASAEASGSVDRTGVSGKLEANVGHHFDASARVGNKHNNVALGVKGGTVGTEGAAKF